MKQTNQVPHYHLSVGKHPSSWKSKVNGEEQFGLEVIIDPLKKHTLD
jgi:hypothetical protein